ncbi:MAG: hypothetical protein R3Y35_12020 [Clostridia bacterium]
MSRNYRYAKKAKSTRKIGKLKNKKMLISLVSIALIITSTIALTLAYKTDTTSIITNIFNPPEIETQIEETFDGVVKTNVTVTNTEESDTDVYVRLKFVVQTLEAVYDSEGYPIMVDKDGTDVYVDYNEGGTIAGYYTNDEKTTAYVYDKTQDLVLFYKSGDIIATPDSFDVNGYLLNEPINIMNVLEVTGLNVDFSGSGYADWFTDSAQETGIYFYKYSLAPGETAYDLVTDIIQEVYYEDTIVRLTVLTDSVQVDGVEDAWVNVNQSNTYTDANGNPILYSSTYVEGTTGAEPNYNRIAADDFTDITSVTVVNGSITSIDPQTDSETGEKFVNYVQRFSSNYDDTDNVNSFDVDLVNNNIAEND